MSEDTKQNWDMPIVNDGVGKDVEPSLKAVSVKTSISACFKTDEIIRAVRKRLMDKYGTKADNAVAHPDPIIRMNGRIVNAEPIVDAMALRYLNMFVAICVANGMESYEEGVRARLSVYHAGEAPSKIFDVESVANSVRRKAMAMVEAAIDDPSVFAVPTGELFMDPKGGK